MSKGLLILISGIVLLIATFIWDYIDNKNKGNREEELLKKITTREVNITNDSTRFINDETERIDDSTVALDDSTVSLDKTERIY